MEGFSYQRTFDSVTIKAGTLVTVEYTNGHTINGIVTTVEPSTLKFTTVEISSENQSLVNVEKTVYIGELDHTVKSISFSERLSSDTKTKEQTQSQATNERKEEPSQNREIPPFSPFGQPFNFDLSDLGKLGDLGKIFDMGKVAKNLGGLGSFDKVLKDFTNTMQQTMQQTTDQSRPAQTTTAQKAFDNFDELVKSIKGEDPITIASVAVLMNASERAKLLYSLTEEKMLAVQKEIEKLTKQSQEKKSPTEEKITDIFSQFPGGNPLEALKDLEGMEDLMDSVNEMARKLESKLFGNLDDQDDEDNK